MIFALVGRGASRAQRQKSFHNLLTGGLHAMQESFSRFSCGCVVGRVACSARAFVTIFVQAGRVEKKNMIFALVGRGAGRTQREKTFHNFHTGGSRGGCHAAQFFNDVRVGGS